MSLEALLDEIEALGQRQVDTLRREEQAQCTSLLEQAQQQAGELRRAACEQEVLLGRRQAAQIEQEARFSAEQLNQAQVQALVQDALELLRAALQGARSQPVYAAALRGLLAESLSAARSLCSSEKLCVHADPADETALQEWLGAEKIPVELVCDLSCCGGVQVEAHDGRILLDNTLERRFERALPRLRRYFFDQFHRAAAQEEEKA